MHRRVFHIFLAMMLIAALMTGCSPVSYKELSEPELDTGASAGSVTSSNDGTTISIRFKGVMNAHSYGYSVDNDMSQSRATADETPRLIIKADVKPLSDGFYSMEINTAALPEIAENGYMISIYASRSSTNPEADSWEFMTAISVSKERVDINSVSPEAYVYARNENSVVIQIASELIPGGMEFGYSINGNPSITAAGLSDDNQITIDNLDSNTDYQINLYHRYSGEEWGTLPCKAQSGVYTGSVTMELSAQSNMLIVSNIPSNADSIVLMNLTGSSRFLEGLRSN